jgi:hypothetical protein
MTVSHAVRRRRRWRWLRLAIPFLVLGLFWGGTTLARAIEEPDLDDPGTLSPAGTGRDGSSQLAELLVAGGIQIERVTSTKEAIAAAARGDATIFAPTPDFLGPQFLDRAHRLPGQHRVVIVKPNLRAFILQDLPFAEIGDRWATGISPPRCDTARLGSGGGPIGRASLRRARYAPYAEPEDVTIDCFGGAVVGYRSGDTEVVVVGATEPFRNDRIDEETNQALATALLSQHDRLIWLDVHSKEPIERSGVDLPAPHLPEYRRGQQDRTNTGYPTIDAFPARLWVLLLLGAVVLVLLALARARRLGGPVAEPLPVLVPAAESVTGRGRLYQRIDARQATLEALRGAAIRRIAKVLKPFGTPVPPSDQLAAQVAQLTGRQEHTVRAVLFGPAPETDEGLAAAVWDLDELVTAVVHDTNPEQARSEQGGPA